jgi:hypothetical protein
MSKYINGPTNFVKMKGSINGITKSLYIFMDSHRSLEQQTKCQSFDSIDIAHFLYKIIKKTKEPLDFFMEIRKEQINMERDNKRNIYMREVIDLFKSEFKTEKDKVLYSRSNNNVRLHYSDIRDFFDMFKVLDMMDYLIEKYNPKTTKLETIIKYMKKVTDFIDKLSMMKIVVGEDKNNKYEKETSLYYLNKIANKYSSSQLKDNINLFLNNELVNDIDLLYKKINQLKIIKNDNIIKELKDIKELLIDIYSIFTDVYMLRRVLDKDYIKNIITYSGSQHSMNYIYFLVKYYDFKITHIFYSEEKNIDKLNEIIKKVNSPRYIYNIFGYTNNMELELKKLQQCIEMPLWITKEGEERLIK